ncbi:hypothetical protein CEXT_69441 [Caerostris extrusa]|uniref:Uncharacterized protein n=1 Tax=Caerostris extrusa TaxID=172846 RepID=A0AAV4R513_CAEEX|nr:hypothetical protein CEXT_69441 [Caerostris extrusa]
MDSGKPKLLGSGEVWALDESRIVIFRHYLPVPFLSVVAVSQAQSPESNPDSPLPVTTMVGAEPANDS